MKIYINFLIFSFIKSFLYIFSITLSLVLILNILTEIEFFKDLNAKTVIPIYLTLLNSPSTIFEMFPFVFLIATQFFFINLFKDNQLEVFKYSGLKNSKIISILSITSFILGIFIIFFFYNLSSNLQNVYLKIKNQYTQDDKYLAVITKNGLWIRDKINKKSMIINASSIKDNNLLNLFISEFDENYNLIRHIKSEKTDIKNNEWKIYNASIYKENLNFQEDVILMETNFNYEKIKNLFSNLSSLSILELYNLKMNYDSLGYSSTDIDLHLFKLSSYPVFLTLMTIISAIIMLSTKRLSGSTLKISIGLFISVLIYYLNNFFYVLGKAEKINLIFSTFVPILILTLFSVILLYRINEK